MSSESDELQWFAYYTRARHEQRVEERVRALAFEGFVPRIPMERQWKDRKKIVEWPLFPGYIFVRCALKDTRAITSTSSVVSIVSNNGKPAPVHMSELDNIRRLITSVTGTSVVIERVQIAPGVVVRVTDGPLKGIDGIVIEQRNHRKFVVQLTTIGEGLLVHVDDRLLEVKPVGDIGGDASCVRLQNAAPQSKFYRL